MACLYNIWRMTASLPLLPTDDDFDRPASPRVRFQELAQVWLIVHSLLLDRVCGTTYLHLRDSEHSTYFPGFPPPVTEDALSLEKYTL